MTARDESEMWDPLLANLFEQAPGFLAIMEGPEHVFQLANRAYRHLVGDRKLIGLGVREAFPELKGAAILDELDRAFATGRPFTASRLPFRFSHREGGLQDERFLDFIYQPVIGPDGSSRGIFCQGSEVTDLVLAEQRLAAKAQELQAEREMFNTALSFSDDFNYLFDCEGRFTFVNKTLLALWGLPLADAVGKTFLQLPYETVLAEQLHREVRSVAESGVQVRGQTYYQSPTGEEGWYEYIFNPVRDEGGAIVSVAGSTRNITARVKQEQRMAALMDSERVARAESERAGRVKDEFLATLSHELRTPLNSIMGWTHLLLNGTLSPEKAKEGIERIRRNGKAQAQLISDLLDMNVIASAKMRLQLQRVPIQEPLLAALESVAPDAAKKGVAISAPLTDGSVVVQCDPDRLQQVFWNLLANAVKFTPAGGAVAVAIDCAPDAVGIAISDSGCGIDAGFLPRMFDRFTQADGSTTRGYGGLGLGLSISKSLVEMHGGRIEVHSEGSGRGTTFLVTLPLRLEAAAAAEPSWSESAYAPMPAEREAASLRDRHILIVDDDVESRAVLHQILHGYGAIVTESPSADGAMAALARRPYALMLSDIGMPVKDGYALMREVRSSTEPGVARVRAIALTAFAGPGDEALALAAGYHAYLAKPAEPGRIVQACLRLLAASA